MADPVEILRLNSQDGSFGTPKSGVMPSAHVKDWSDRKNLPSVCPKCGRPLALYVDYARCICGWDSRDEAVKRS